VETRAPAGTDFVFTYAVSDSAKGAAAKQSLRKVAIVDTTAPVIDLGPDGDTPIRTERGEPFVEPFTDTSAIDATAKDNVDDHPWITDQISYDLCKGKWESGPKKDQDRCIDTDQPAFEEFTITYNCVDFAGNRAVPVERKVIVVDNTPPTIEIPDAVAGDAGNPVEAGQALPTFEVNAADSADGPYEFTFVDGGGAAGSDSGGLRHASRIRLVTTLSVRSLDSCPTDREHFIEQECPSCFGRCKLATTCGAGEFESVPLTERADRTCQTVSNCDLILANRSLVLQQETVGGALAQPCPCPPLWFRLVGSAQPNKLRAGSATKLRAGSATKLRAGSATKLRAGSATKPRAGSATKPRAGSATKPRAGSATKLRAGSATKPRAGSATKLRVGSATKPRAGSATKLRVGCVVFIRVSTCLGQAFVFVLVGLLVSDARLEEGFADASAEVCR
jgi:hypothetical protein